MKIFEQYFLITLFLGEYSMVNDNLFSSVGGFFSSIKDTSPLVACVGGIVVCACILGGIAIKLVENAQTSA